MYCHTSARGRLIPCLKEKEWSVFRMSVTHWEILRMESLPRGWKPACPKCLLFLALSTAPSFFVLMSLEGDAAAGQPLPGTWEIWTIFLPRLKLGQLPKVSASPPICTVWAVHTGLPFTHSSSVLSAVWSLAGRCYFSLCVCVQHKDISRFCYRNNNFKCLQHFSALLCFLSLSSWKGLECFYSIFSGQPKHLLSSLQAKCPVNTLYCGIDLLGFAQNAFCT